MLILLPPSEGKSSPAPGADTARLSFSPLNDTRQRILEALIRMCSDDPSGAAKALGLGSTQIDEIKINAQLASAAFGPAIEVYDGVLYEALDAQSLPAIARRRLNANVAIASGLFGLVRPLDLIPAYRLSGNVRLAGLPSLGSLWRNELGAAIADSSGPIIDLRSQTYVVLGPVPLECHSRALAVRVLFEQDGHRTVVSHFNKATKGRLVRELMLMGSAARSVNQFLQQLTSLGYEWELHETSKGPSRLDLITH
ncbi:MAG: peroxide stress protein YaaA [Candidatus Nanopelagicales bacterium]